MAVASIFQRFRDLEIPAADRERKPGHGACLRIDCRAHDAGSAAPPRRENVAAREIHGLAGGKTQFAGVHAALRAVQLDAGRFSGIGKSWEILEPWRSQDLGGNECQQHEKGSGRVHLNTSDVVANIFWLRSPSDTGR